MSFANYLIVSSDNQDCVYKVYEPGKSSIGDIQFVRRRSSSIKVQTKLIAQVTE